MYKQIYKVLYLEHSYMCTGQKVYITITTTNILQLKKSLILYPFLIFKSHLDIPDIPSTNPPIYNTGDKSLLSRDRRKQTPVKE